MNLLYMRHLENGYWIAIYASYNLCVMFHSNQRIIKMGHPRVSDVNFRDHNLEDANVPFQIFKGVNSKMSKRTERINIPKNIYDTPPPQK